MRKGFACDCIDPKRQKHSCPVYSCQGSTKPMTTRIFEVHIAGQSAANFCSFALIVPKLCLAHTHIKLTIVSNYN